MSKPQFFRIGQLNDKQSSVGVRYSYMSVIDTMQQTSSSVETDSCGAFLWIRILILFPLDAGWR